MGNADACISHPSAGQEVWNNSLSELARRETKRQREMSDHRGLQSAVLSAASQAPNPPTVYHHEASPSREDKAEIADTTINECIKYLGNKPKTKIAIQHLTTLRESYRLNAERIGVAVNWYYPKTQKAKQRGLKNLCFFSLALICFVAVVWASVNGYLP